MRRNSQIGQPCAIIEGIVVYQCNSVWNDDLFKATAIVKAVFRYGSQML